MIPFYVVNNILRRYSFIESLYTWPFYFFHVLRSTKIRLMVKYVVVFIVFFEIYGSITFQPKYLYWEAYRQLGQSPRYAYHKFCGT